MQQVLCARQSWVLKAGSQPGKTGRGFENMEAMLSAQTLRGREREGGEGRRKRPHLVGQGPVDTGMRPEQRQLLPKEEGQFCTGRARPSDSGPGEQPRGPGRHVRGSRGQWGSWRGGRRPDAASGCPAETQSQCGHDFRISMCSLLALDVDKA